MSSEPENVPFDWRNDPWLGHQFWNENRANCPEEVLAAHTGQVVAWIPDGSGVRAAGPSRDAVWEQIEAEGEDPSPYVYEYLESGSQL